MHRRSPTSARRPPRPMSARTRWGSASPMTWRARPSSCCRPPRAGSPARRCWSTAAIRPGERMTDYVLVGGGGLAREILDWFAPSLAGSGSRFIGFLHDGDDDPMAPFGRRLPHLGPIDAHRAREGQQLVMAIGAPGGKLKVAERLAAR